MKLYFDENLKLSAYDYEETNKGTIGYDYLAVYVPKTLVQKYNGFAVRYYAKLPDGDEIGAISLGATLSDVGSNYEYKQLMTDKINSQKGTVLITIEFAIKRTANDLWVYKTSGALKHQVYDAVVVDGDIIVGADSDYPNIVGSMKENINSMQNDVDKNTQTLSKLVNNTIYIENDDEDYILVEDTEDYTLYRVDYYGDYLNDIESKNTILFERVNNGYEVYKLSDKTNRYIYSSINNPNNYFQVYYYENDGCWRFNHYLLKGNLADNNNAYVKGNIVNNAIENAISESKNYTDEKVSVKADLTNNKQVITAKQINVKALKDETASGTTYSHIDMSYVKPFFKSEHFTGRNTKTKQLLFEEDYILSSFTDKDNNNNKVNNYTRMYKDRTVFDKDVQIAQMGAEETSATNIGWVRNLISEAMKEHIVNQYFTETSTTRTLHLVLNDGREKTATYTKEQWRVLQSASFNQETMQLTLDFNTGDDVVIDLSNLRDVYDVDNNGHNVNLSLNDGKFSADLDADVETFLDNAQVAESVRISNETAREAYFNSVKSAIANNNGKVSVYNFSNNGDGTFDLSFNDVNLPN